MQQKINNRSQLIYALTEAAELEHTLMCQYLFAAASLKTSVQELSNKQRCYYQIELIREWKKLLLQVAREEMQHLTYVINLLVSVGGTPVFNRPNFPNCNRFYKSEDGRYDVMMTLEKFGIETVKRFIHFEAPPAHIRNKMGLIAAVPDPNYYQNLHDFYTAIKEAFNIEDIFVDYEDQYDPLDEKRSAKVAYRKSVSNVVKNAKEAEALIDLIMEQGEGSSAGDDLAHAHIFHKILKEFQNERDADSSFEPARDVLSNPMTRIQDDLQNNLKQHITVINKDLDNGLPFNLLQLFNAAYEILLTWLFQVFNRHGSKEELLAIESLTFMPYMSEVIRPIMEILTRIPVSINTKKGQRGYLGASFEVTSNNFLIPKPEITHRLTIERLMEMEELCCKITCQLQASTFDEIASVKEDFLFIQKTILLLRKEFESRVKIGCPPLTDPNVLDYSKSEVSELIKPKVITPQLITNIEWNLRGPSILKLDFQGWFITWLAADPDSANDKRGCSGNNFAIGDEPDFDRVIYLQDIKKLKRSHCPDIGVKVTNATIIKAPMNLNIVEKQVTEFEGASIDLLNNPKFEGRNHIVAGNGEPVDPFDISIKTLDGKISLRRAVVGSGEINEMTSAQRAGSGRYFKEAQISVERMTDFLTRIDGGYISPHHYLDDRIKALEAALQNFTGDELSCEVQKIKFRLKCLEETKQSSIGNPVPGYIRWTRFFFAFYYTHTISGIGEINMGGADLGFIIRAIQPNDIQSKWLVEYNMGFFDSDALSGFMYGTLKIPIE